MNKEQAIVCLRHAIRHLQRVENKHPLKESRFDLGQPAIPAAISIIQRHGINLLTPREPRPGPHILNSPGRDWFLCGPDFAMSSDEN